MYLAKQYIPEWRSRFACMFCTTGYPTIFAMDEKVYGLDGKIAVLS